MGSTTLTLVSHPDLPSGRVASISVEVSRSRDGELLLRYLVDALPSELRLSGQDEPVRTDGLWKSTCFEAFVRTPESSQYLEFNFSPSSRWAAYRFEAYRAVMTDLLIPSPETLLDVSKDCIAIESLVWLPAPWADLAIEMALSAVIEETDGTKSYWALAHPHGAPDFHHADCFALTLPAPSTP